MSAESRHLKRRGGGMLRGVAGTSVLLASLGFASSALADSASVAIIILGPGSATVGTTYQMGVSLTNLSRTDLPTGAPVGASLRPGATVDVKFDCTTAECTALANKVSFNACASWTDAPADMTCAKVAGEEIVRFGFPTGMTLPYNTSVNFGLITLNADANGGVDVWARGDSIGPGVAPNPTLAVVTNGSVAQTPASLPAYANATGTRDVILNDAPPEPEVEIVKEVSCDGGASWVDSCVAPLSQAMLVRYTVRNLTEEGPISGCVLTESNGAFGTPLTISSNIFATYLETGFQEVFSGTLTPACSDSRGGEPNTATVTCNVFDGDPVDPFGDSDTANFSCASEPPPVPAASPLGLLVLTSLLGLAGVLGLRRRIK